MERETFSMQARRAQRNKPKSSEESESVKRTKAAATSTAVADREPEGDDEEGDILSSLKDGKRSKTPLLFVVAGVALVLIVVFLFVVFGMSSRKEPTQNMPSSETYNETQGEVVQQPTNNGQSTAQQETTSQLPAGMGTQDFTQDTNMTTSETLTNPDEFVEDLYGLTTRVDYTVNSITNVADFVSYTKHRGTWGGGLELYWLEADYKGRQYVVQVPFKYYKELDDTGIVPVKMEVLSITGSTAGETLTVISYMCLDEETLEDVLKSQAKAK